MKSSRKIANRQARLYFPDSRVKHFKNQRLAYSVWLALPKGTRAAFRGADDPRPVHPWDYADQP